MKLAIALGLLAVLATGCPDKDRKVLAYLVDLWPPLSSVAVCLVLHGGYFSCFFSYLIVLSYAYNIFRHPTREGQRCLRAACSGFLVDMA